MRPETYCEADRLEAWITALFANAGIPVECVPELRTATLSEIARSAREIADIMIGRPPAKLH